MNTNTQESVAGAITIRRQVQPKKAPRKSRSKFAYLFDFTDERERRMCHSMSILHLSPNYRPISFRRELVSIGGQLQRVIFEIVRLGGKVHGKRWEVVAWIINSHRVRIFMHSTRRAAAAFIRSAAIVLPAE